MPCTRRSRRIGKAATALRDLGVELIHCKGAYYDWARTLADAVAFNDSRALPRRRGFSL